MKKTIIPWFLLLLALVYIMVNFWKLGPANYTAPLKMFMVSFFRRKKWKILAKKLLIGSNKPQ